MAEDKREVTVYVASTGKTYRGNPATGRYIEVKEERK